MISNLPTCNNSHSIFSNPSFSMHNEKEKERVKNSDTTGKIKETVLLNNQSHPTNFCKSPIKRRRKNVRLVSTPKESTTQATKDSTTQVAKKCLDMAQKPLSDSSPSSFFSSPLDFSPSLDLAAAVRSYRSKHNKRVLAPPVAVKNTSDSWSIDETNLLNSLNIDSSRKPHGYWIKIAEQFPRKTPIQCCQKFKALNAMMKRPITAQELSFIDKAVKSGKFLRKDGRISWCKMVEEFNKKFCPTAPVKNIYIQVVYKQAIARGVFIQMPAQHSLSVSILSPSTNSSLSSTVSSSSSSSSSVGSSSSSSSSKASLIQPKRKISKIAATAKLGKSIKVKKTSLGLPLKSAQLTPKKNKILKNW